MGATDVATPVSEAAAEIRRIDAGAWRSDSLCKKYPTHWWFAGGAHETVLARGICAGCPVQGSCLEFALGRPDLLGVWASTTPNERAAIRRTRRDVADGVDLPALELEEATAGSAGPFVTDVSFDRPAVGAARVSPEVVTAPLEPAREPGRRPRRGRGPSAGLGDGNELFTPAEAARRLGVTPNTVTRWSRAGKISAIQTMGGHRRFRRDEIDRILREANVLGPGIGRRGDGRSIGNRVIT